jgi:hypothetical protein
MSFLSLSLNVRRSLCKALHNLEAIDRFIILMGAYSKAQRSQQLHTSAQTQVLYHLSLKWMLSLSILHNLMHLYHLGVSEMLL